LDQASRREPRGASKSGGQGRQLCRLGPEGAWKVGKRLPVECGSVCAFPESPAPGEVRRDGQKNKSPNTQRGLTETVRGVGVCLGQRHDLRCARYADALIASMAAPTRAQAEASKQQSRKNLRSRCLYPIQSRDLLDPEIPPDEAPQKDAPIKAS
jgi:hypothetical protein